MSFLPCPKYHGCNSRQQEQSHDSLRPKFILGRHVGKTALAKNTGTISMFFVLRDAHCEVKEYWYHLRVLHIERRPL